MDVGGCRSCCFCCPVSMTYSSITLGGKYVLGYGFALGICSFRFDLFDCVLRMSMLFVMFPLVVLSPNSVTHKNNGRSLFFCDSKNKAAREEE